MRRFRLTKHKRFVKLGWELLEHKFRYYVLNTQKIQDYDYDMLEKEYEALAEELGLPSSASDMIGFKQDRPCCMLVASKIVKEAKTNGSKIVQYPEEEITRWRKTDWQVIIREVILETNKKTKKRA